MSGSSRRLYMTFAAVSFATILLAVLLAAPIVKFKPDRRVAFEFDEPLSSTPAPPAP